MEQEVKIPAFLDIPIEQIKREEIDGAGLIKVCRDIDYPFILAESVDLPKDRFEEENRQSELSLQLLDKIGADIYDVFRIWDESDYWGNMRIYSFPKGSQAQEVLQSYVSPEYDALIESDDCFLIEPVTPQYAFQCLTEIAVGCTYCRKCEPGVAKQYAWHTFAKAAGFDWQAPPDDIEDALEGVQWYELDPEQSGLFSDWASAWFICINLNKNWLIDIRIEDDRS